MSEFRIYSLNAEDGAIIDEISDIDAEIFPGNIWGRDSYARSAANDYDFLIAYLFDEADCASSEASESDEEREAADEETEASAGPVQPDKAAANSNENAQTAGFALLRCFDDAELIRIAVAPKYRRLGYGRKLMDALIKEAADRGIGNIFLEVRRGNAAAIRLYESAGFEQTGVRKDYYHAPKEDALIMRYTC